MDDRPRKVDIASYFKSKMLHEDARYRMCAQYIFLVNSLKARLEARNAAFTSTKIGRFDAGKFIGNKFCKNNF